MRNLKKVLTLTLAFVMTLGLMSGFGAGARTNFDDFWMLSENEARAVDVLSELNIVGGTNSAGTIFNPEGTIDRASMAKLIYVAVNRGVDDGAVRFTAEGDNNPFADVSDTHWGNGYINWAFRMGHISGRGVDAAGVRFDPRADVTLIEAARMLLGMLGYDGNQLGFAGSGWETNVANRAMSAGLFHDDFADVGNRQALTRAQAALIVYTAINADSVTTHQGIVNPNRNEVTNRVMSFAENDMGLTRVAGTVIANDGGSLTGATGEAGITRIAPTREFANGNTAAWESESYSVAPLSEIPRIEEIPVASGSDMLGREVWIYVRKNPNNDRIIRAFGSVQEITAATGSYDRNRNTIALARTSGVEIGRGYVAGNNVVAQFPPEIVKVPVYVNGNLLAGTENFLIGGTDFYYGSQNGKEFDNYPNDKSADRRVHTLNSASGITFCGWQSALTNIMYVVNERGVVIRVLAEDWAFGTVTSKTADRLGFTVFANGETESKTNMRDVIGFADVNVRDRILSQNLRGIDGNDVWTVLPAEYITGRVTAVRNDLDDGRGELRINDANYNFTWRATANTAWGTGRTTTAFRDLANAELRFYLDKTGRIIDWDQAPEVIGTQNYLVLTRLVGQRSLDPVTNTETFNVWATVVADDGRGERTYPLASYDPSPIPTSPNTNISTARNLFNHFRPDGATNQYEINFDVEDGKLIAGSAAELYAYSILSNDRLAIRAIQEFEPAVTGNANRPITGSINAGTLPNSLYEAGTRTWNLGAHGSTTLGAPGVAPSAIPNTLSVDATSKFFIRTVREVVVSPGVTEDRVTWTFAEGRPNFDFTAAGGTIYTNRGFTANSRLAVAHLTGVNETDIAGARSWFLLGDNDPGAFSIEWIAERDAWRYRVGLVSLSGVSGMYDAFFEDHGAAIDFKDTIKAGGVVQLNVNENNEITNTAPGDVQHRSFASACDTITTPVQPENSWIIGYLVDKDEYNAAVIGCGTVSANIIGDPDNADGRIWNNDRIKTLQLADEVVCIDLGWGSGTLINIANFVTMPVPDTTTNNADEPSGSNSERGSKYLFQLNRDGEIVTMIRLVAADRQFALRDGKIRFV